MDSIMFSPYGVGPLPPSAMAEIERKTAALRTSNFRRMLELEKQYKMERLQSAPVSPPSSPPPEDRQSLQVRRADSLSQHQNYLMLKAARRSAVIPSLSISIPQPAGEQRREASREAAAEGDAGRGDENETGAAAEPLHKQVKFLAPDEEGEMSDQSSICQSPSWEGYGQRKKEKKKEAERRKKEKERAEKEAKAAKKRNASRLGKSPQLLPTRPDSRTGGLTLADRTMSDPLLISQYLLPDTQSSIPPPDIGRAASADDLQQLRNHQPAVAEIISDPDSNIRRFVGGVKLERERDAALHAQLDTQSQLSPSFSHHLMSEDGFYPHQNPHSPPPDGSVPAGYPSTQSLPAKHEGRPPREAFPPSASRTPMLRHMSASAHQRSNSLLQGATKIFKGRDAKNHGEVEVDRGRDRDGNVQNHRDQSTERSMAELAYEQLVNNGSLHSSSTRSSSRHTQSRRRSSFTQEARSVAKKLAGIKATPPARESPANGKRGSVQYDYFNHLEHSSSVYGYDNSSHSGSVPPSLRSQESSGESAHHTLADEQRMAMSEGALPHGIHSFRDSAAAQERPATAQSSISAGNRSMTGSIPSSQGKKTRSLRDAAKAALNISRGAPPSSNASRPLAPVQSLSTLREPGSSVLGEGTAPVVSPVSPTLPEPSARSNVKGSLGGGQSRATNSPSSKTQPAASSVVKPAEVEAHVGCRASEGSSSSSAYEDGSPLPSPVTTPDTSRPQSSKDLPFTVGEVAKAYTDLLPAQDDDATLRQSSESSGGSSTSSNSSTPRVVKSETRGGEEITDEDRWSRTALPIEIDCDAQSFTTSFSNLDNIDNIDETLANALVVSKAAAEAQSARSRGKEDRSAPGRARSPEYTRSRPQQPRLSKSLSDPTLRSSFLGNITNPNDNEPSTDPPISIPPRSKKRELVAGRSPTSPAVNSSSQQAEEHSVSRGQDRGPSDVEAVRTERRGAKREKGKRRQQQNEGTSYFVDLPASTESQSGSTLVSSPTNVSPTSPRSQGFAGTSSPVPQTGPPRMTSAASPLSRPSSAASTRSSTTLPSGPIPTLTPSVTRPAGVTPVSILKQPTRSMSDPASPLASAASRAPVLSALPKHMQLQAGLPIRPPIMTMEARMSPIAKMFVECCQCKFYHDMPSKLYECMARPDAVVEDRLLGISGAITTMVKCPWCQHNMSTNCCAGYAAVVYLKEKLH